MNVKKEAYDNIIKHLRDQIRHIDGDIRHNKRRFKDIEYEQTVLKRQRAKLIELINAVEGSKPKEQP